MFKFQFQFLSQFQFLFQLEFQFQFKFKFQFQFKCQFQLKLQINSNSSYSPCAASSSSSSYSSSSAPSYISSSSSNPSSNSSSSSSSSFSSNSSSRPRPGSSSFFCGRSVFSQRFWWISRGESVTIRSASRRINCTQLKALFQCAGLSRTATDFDVRGLRDFTLKTTMLVSSLGRGRFRSRRSDAFICRRKRFRWLRLVESVDEWMTVEDGSPWMDLSISKHTGIPFNIS